MHQEIKKCDAVFVLGSIDDRVAEYGANLFLKSYGKWLIISGGVAHKNDLLATEWSEATEAEHFAEIARKMGVPSDKILTEYKATDTGENIKFAYELLLLKGININSILLVHKPYMERRTYATFEKQWPDKNTHFMVTSPPIEYDAYFNELQPKDKIVNIMVGDLQRIKEYAKLGFQSEQAIPDEVWNAYEELVSQGFNEHLIKQTP
jgi:uncharacterized SAM-binding protein YcdF (DUF218 family)